MSTPRSNIGNASYLVAAALFVLAPGESRAGNWPGWRGPTGAGYSDETDLPLTWGGKKDENVLWKVDLKGKSFSSPIVWGDQVFITNAARQTDADVKSKLVPEHWVICYGAADGKERWKTSVPPGKFADGYYTIPTPVTDGKRVYAWFGSGVMAAVDFEPIGPLIPRSGYRASSSSIRVKASTHSSSAALANRLPSVVAWASVWLRPTITTSAYSAAKSRRVENKASYVPCRSA